MTDLRDLLTDKAAELSNPHPLFDVAYYLKQRPDLRSPGSPHPLQHYLQYGYAEGVDPHPMFNTRFYLGQCGNDQEAAAAPLTHFLTTGWRMRLDPHPLFSIVYYLERHPDVAAAGINPLMHVLLTETAALGDVSPWFNGRYYLATNPDLVDNIISPLDHYFRHGVAEGRAGSILAHSLLAKRPEYRRDFGVLDMACECHDTLPGLRHSHKLSEERLRDAREAIASFAYRPIASLLMNATIGHTATQIRDTVDSVVAQVYEAWQLCVVVDAAIPDASDLVRELMGKHPSISAVRQAERDDALALNLALAMASGHYVGIVEPGDRLHLLALQRLIGAMQDGEAVDLVYGDEDVVDDQGTHSDVFHKPDWSPEYLLSNDYTAGLALYRRQLVRRLGGYRPDVDCSFDLALRAASSLDESSVRHVHGVVYHRRRLDTDRHEAYRDDRLYRSIAAFVQAEGLNAEVLSSTRPGFHRVVLHATAEPLVSIVIPTGNASFAGPLGREWTVMTCVAGLREKTSYRNIEIIVVHDGNLLPEQKQTLQEQGVLLVAFDRPVFNFSRTINLGVKASKGEYILLLNDDTEPKRDNWLDIMLGYAERAGVGVVGCKLFFPDGQLQHTGIILQDGDPGHLYYRGDGEDPGLHESNVVARNCLAVTGACQLVTRTVFDAVGGYDEKLPLNFNDVDFCLRVRDAGLRIVQAAAAEMFHFEGVSKERLTGARLTLPAETREFRARWRERYRDDPFYHPDLPAYMPQGWTALGDTVPTPSQARIVPGARAAASAGVNFLGPINRSSGLGTAARSYVAALQMAGAKVNIQPMDKIYGHQTLIESGLVSTFQDYPITLLQANADATPAVYGHYNEALRRAKYRIGVWVWELPAARIGSFDAIRHYDEIWVPSSFNQEAYQPLTGSPVTVVPYALTGLPELSPVDACSARQKHGITVDSFVFLYMFDTFSLVERKNPTCLLDAFEAEFGGRKDVMLVLKVSYYDNLLSSVYPANRRFLKRLTDLIDRCPNVRLITDILTSDDLYRLINAADCYVSPHRSEGFGLTIAESMFYRKTVIATDYSGTRDMVLETTGLPLRFDLIEIEEDVGPYAKGNVWADPSVEHLRELMVRAATDAGLRSRLGDAARAHVTSRFSPESIGRLARDRLRLVAATL